MKLTILSVLFLTVFGFAQEKEQAYFTLEDQDFKIGSIYQLDSIEFDFDGCGLRPKSKAALTKVIKFLAINSHLLIEVGVHTDDRGNDAYNLDLSERRAKQIVDYLNSKGIPMARLIPKGYGESKPYVTRNKDDLFTIGTELSGPYLRKVKNRDSAEQGYQMNRRAELKIIGLEFVDTFNLMVDTFPQLPDENNLLYTDSSGWNKKSQVIEGIEYDFDRAQLRPRSQMILDGLVTFLQKNDSLVIEISNHSDCRGSEYYGTNLTQRRAQVVANYLIDNGISEERIIPKGYGETTPYVHGSIVLSCEYILTVESIKERERLHQMNRRTAFRIIRTDYETK